MSSNKGIHEGHYAHQLADQIERGSQFANLRVKLPQISLLAKLRRAPLSNRIYWRSRDGSEEVCAFGVADEICTNSEQVFRATLAEKLSTLDDRARFYGGIRFNPQARASEEWHGHESFRFVLPSIEVRRYREVCEIRVLGDVMTDEACRAWLSDFWAFEPEVETESVGQLSSRTNLPEYSGWKSNVEWILEAISRSPLGKVVLARRVQLEFEEKVNTFALFQRLVAAAPACYHFLTEFSDGKVFLGASPERLLRTSGRDIRSEAVAGTRPRGDDDSTDRLLGEELLSSEKDQREHLYVRQNIKAVLNELCELLHVDTDASEMKIATGRHLVSYIEGKLKSDVIPIDAVLALHPTPAVGGDPTEYSLEVIDGLEPFDRGLYAGPVGWIGKSASEFAVAIRSGLVTGSTLFLYSGAGIVGGSNPQSEWQEIEQKISGFLDAIGLSEISTK